MAQVSLSKSSLKREREQLVTYERFLPSLDLKRRQLLWELRRAESEKAKIDERVAQLYESARELFSLLGGTGDDLGPIATLRGVEMAEDNVVGVRLPRVVAVDLEVAPYSTLAKPFWFDTLVDKLSALLELRAHQSAARRRVELLALAVRKVTQRVNLFEKVLIPQGKENIAKIRIHLADAERAAVVRSKIVKAKRAAPVAGG